jgi:N-acylneuraminate cytidylyltransferase
VKAIVPVKRNSERLKDKNFREFCDGHSLFDIRMKRLLKVMPAEDIYVSSENPEVEVKAAQYGANFLLRDLHLTHNTTPMAEVITSIVSQVPGDDDIMWSQVTEPFFADIGECLRVWNGFKLDVFDSLVVVKKFKNFMLDGNGRPVNFHFGQWHRSSQMLPTWFLLPFTLLIAKREAIFRCSYYIGTKPFLYKYDGTLVDIDNEEDFMVAQSVFKTLRCMDEIKEV